MFLKTLLGDSYNLQLSFARSRTPLLKTLNCFQSYSNPTKVQLKAVHLHDPIKLELAMVVMAVVKCL